MKIRTRLSQQYDSYVARRVAMDVFSMTKEQLIMEGNGIVNPLLLAKMDTMISECLSGKPLAYVLGYEVFCCHRFVVSEHVLIPRSETEELVQFVLKSREGKGTDILVDMGTGSGCVGLSIAKQLATEASVVLCDVSEDALSVAQQNIESLGVNAITRKVDVMKLEKDPQGLDRFLDGKDEVVIVANLPYIPDDYTGVEEDVDSREPHLALYSGDDGLDHYRALLRRAEPGRSVWMEMMTGQVVALEKEFGKMVVHSTLHSNIVMVEYCC